MLLRLPALEAKGVRRSGVCAWQAFNDDPQLTFAPKWLAARYLVIEVSKADRQLDPRLYLFYGEEPQEVELRPTQSGLYAIALGGFKGLRRVRFDPSSYPSSFELRAYVGYDEAAVRSFIARRLKSAGRNGAPIPTCETIAAPKHAALADVGARAVKIRSVSQHYEQVVGMASAIFSNAPPWGEKSPLISFICPVYNAPQHYLDQLWESFRIQLQGAWELVICDDASTSRATRDWLAAHRDAPSLRFVENATNGGIAKATNAALAVARSPFVAFLDHDDALTPFAVDRIVAAIRANPGAEFFYTDEVVANEKLAPQTYFFKPAYDPVLLTGVNYVNHLSIFKRERLAEIKGLREGFDGSQDYDLLLRYLAGVAADRIVHIPYPAYVWRRDGKSYSAQFIERATANARRAIAEAYGDSMPIEPALDKNLHRLGCERRDRSWPKVSIVIPNRDSCALISRLFDNLLHGTDYSNIEIVVPDNGSKDPQTLALYERMRAADLAFRVEIVEEPFNFSRQVNRGLRLAQGDYLLLLNNDVEVLSADWLKEMVACFDFPDVGVVGARLLYPDGRLQHVGVIAGLGSVAGHWYCGMPATYPGPMGRLFVRQSLSAVTGACMLISRKCFEAVGFFDEEAFAIAYNDTDFCLRAGRTGFRIIYTPFATLRHHESASRGSDETAENIDRFNREKAALRAKYGLTTYQDPAFSPYYDRGDGKGKLTVPAVLPPERIFRV
ncbi:MAG TPA: glycosyltransferase family 2 protein [Methylocystis sp.]|nr:glycosyltransferase family 2 protein [Methylocystis sp.]